MDNDVSSTSKDMSLHVPVIAATSTRMRLILPVLSMALVVGVYSPVFLLTAGRWFFAEQYAHGCLIFPIAAALLWANRRQILAAEAKPCLWGFLPLTLGLLLETVGHTMIVQFIGMLSLVPTIAGLVLILHGIPLWRIVQFPVLFLGFAANLPHVVLDALSQWIQHATATGAAFVTEGLGFAIMQHGNLLTVPGMTLEVAEVCSGFRKLTSLTVIATLFGYLYPLSLLRRILLVALMIPIALIANTARLCALIAAASWGGPVWEGRLHDPAEFAVLALSFALIVVSAKLMGCKPYRFAVPSASPVIDGAKPSDSQAQSGKTRHFAALCPVLLVATLGMDFFLLNDVDGYQVRLDPNTLPVQIGDWRGGPNRPMSDAIRLNNIPTARIMDRIYGNEQGDYINLVLVSSEVAEDAHDPELCFPSQGWKVEPLAAWSLYEKSMHHDRVIQSGHTMDLLFWYETTNPRNNAWINRTEKIRLELHGRGSVLVRLTTMQGARSEAALKDFVRQLVPALREWKQSASKSPAQ